MIKFPKSNAHSKMSLRKLTMFLQGLTVLQPLYLGINAPYYTIRRFNIPDSSVDLYISKINITMQIGYFFGVLLVNFYVYLLPRYIQKYNNYIAVFTNWSTVVSSAFLLVSYVIKGETGSLLLYYYMLTICSLLFGLNQGFVMNAGVSELPWFTSAIPLAGFFVVAFQIGFNHVASLFSFVNIDFAIIVSQITLIIFLCFLTSLLWMLSYMSLEDVDYELEHVIDNEVYDDFDRYYDPEVYPFYVRVWMSRYPLICSAFGLGLLYGFYPAIVPYKLTDIRSAYHVDLVIMSSGSLCALIICLLCEYTRFGPNKNWLDTNSKWLFSVFLIIPYVILPGFFIFSLHYPMAKLSKLIMNNKYVMGGFGLSFTLLHSVLTNAGYAASSRQTNRIHDPDVPPLNVSICYTIMIVVIIYSQGYLTLYSLVESGREFISGSNRAKAFFTWIGKSFIYGFYGFKSTVTSNIRADILNIKS